MRAIDVVILNSQLTGALETGTALPFNSFEAIAAQTAYSNICYNDNAIEDSGVIIEVTFDNELSLVCRLKLHRNGQLNLQDYVGQLMADLDDRMLDPENDEDVESLIELTDTLTQLNFTVH